MLSIRISKLSTFVVFLFTLISRFTGFAHASKLVLLHTNDHHGHYVQDPKKRILGWQRERLL